MHWRIRTSSSRSIPYTGNDVEDAELLYQVLEKEVLPLFNKRGADGLPTEWIQMIRSSIRTLTYQFSAHRMILDYAHQMYREPGK